MARSKTVAVTKWQEENCIKDQASREETCISNQTPERTSISESSWQGRQLYQGAVGREDNYIREQLAKRKIYQRQLPGTKTVSKTSYSNMEASYGISATRWQRGKLYQ